MESVDSYHSVSRVTGLIEAHHNENHVKPKVIILYNNTAPSYSGYQYLPIEKSDAANAIDSYYRNYRITQQINVHYGEIRIELRLIITLIIPSFDAGE